MSKPWGESSPAYEDGYQRGWADALEAAAKECEKQMRKWMTDEYEQCADAVRKLKDTVGGEKEAGR